MATPIKRIEKEFIMKTLYDEQLPVTYNKGQTQYNLILTKPVKEEMEFEISRPITGIEAGKKLDLILDFRGQIISFPAEVISAANNIITAKEPEYFYKNLDRAYSRVSAPNDLQVKFTFTSERYSLSYPKVNEFEPDEEEDLMKSFDANNLNDLVEQMETILKRFASGYKIVVFKDVSPVTTEEKIIAQTGKALFIPSTRKTLPDEDPYPKKRLITEMIFKRFLESSGIDVYNVNDAYLKFIKKKLSKGISSDLWVPILFQEYVIGYIRVWIDRDGFRPFDYGVIDSLYQFSKILAYSLKINKYFESGKIKNNPFEGRIIDISASGLLFSYPISDIAATLMPETELTVELTTPYRTVLNKARVVRTFSDRFRAYFGCNLIEMKNDDLRFLFEYIYGKPFTDRDAVFLSGQV